MSNVHQINSSAYEHLRKRIKRVVDPHSVGVQTDYYSFSQEELEIARELFGPSDEPTREEWMAENHDLTVEGMFERCETIYNSHIEKQQEIDPEKFDWYLDKINLITTTRQLSMVEFLELLKNGYGDYLKEMEIHTEEPDLDSAAENKVATS